MPNIHVKHRIDIGSFEFLIKRLQLKSLTKRSMDLTTSPIPIDKEDKEDRFEDK